jgi:hypothetical protein
LQKIPAAGDKLSTGGDDGGGPENDGSTELPSPAHHDEGGGERDCQGQNNPCRAEGADGDLQQEGAGYAGHKVKQLPVHGINSPSARATSD